MIAFLEGRIHFKSPEYVIVEVQGVGYEVSLPLSSFYDLPPLEGPVQLHIYTHVRQDTIQLFGFLTPLEKRIFLLLIGVTGIGPKLALNILSGISSQDFYQALINQDSHRIQRIPGVGKKTAERIVLELKEKIKKVPLDIPLAAAPGAVGGEKIWEDALSALQNLGYPRPVAEKALEEIRRKWEGEVSLEAVLRRTLKTLSK